MEVTGTSISTPREQISHANSYFLNGKVMLCSVIVLFVAVLAIVCFHGYARWFYKRRRRAQNRLISLHHDEVALRNVPQQGLDLSVLKKLPTFVYVSLKDHDKLLECAVCLSEFEDGEEGIVLPKCKHVFHAECIDMWFYSHSNCPLCRAPVQDSDETEIATDSVVGPGDSMACLCRKEELQMGCSRLTMSGVVLPLGQQRRAVEFVGVVDEESSGNEEERVSGLVGLGKAFTRNQRPKPWVSGIFGLRRICSV